MEETSADEERLKLLKAMNQEKKKILMNIGGLEEIRKLLLLVDMSEIYYLVMKFGNIDILQAYSLIRSVKSKRSVIFEKVIQTENILMEKSLNNKELNDTEINYLITMIELSHIYDKMKDDKYLTFEEAHNEVKKELYDEEDVEYIDDLDDYIKPIECILPDHLEKQMKQYMEELIDIRNKMHVNIDH